MPYFDRKATWRVLIVAGAVLTYAWAGSAAVANDLTTTSSASASSKQYGGALLSCVAGCALQSSTSSGSGANGSTASETSTYTAHSLDGTGSAAAYANPEAGTVGASATGTNDNSHVIGYGYVDSTASAKLTGSVSFTGLTAATYLPVIFTLDGSASTVNLLGAASVTAVLTVWVNNPTGATTCPLNSSASCYEVAYTYNPLVNSVANILNVEANVLATSNWAQGDTISLTSGGGFSFSGDVALGAGNSTLTFTESLTVTAGNGSSANFLYTEGLGLDNSHNPQLNGPSNTPNFLTDPVVLPEPGSMMILGSAVLGMLGFARRKR